MYVEFLNDKEPTTFEIEFDEAHIIDNSPSPWYKTKTGNRINFSLAKSYFFITQVYCRIHDDQWSWRALTDDLLIKIYSDEGQALLLKREMNVPC